MKKKKTKLRIDDLRVESFTAGEARMPRGTVRGHGQEAIASGEVVDQPGDGSANPLCGSPSYVETCIFYTCGGCDSADPEYC
jgi:hypothetical protein